MLVWIHRTLLAAMLLASAACATENASTATPPAAIADQDYRLVKDWNFGRNIKTQDELRDQFYTRYIYNGGKLDTLNDEWQRFRDNDNHVFGDGYLSLVARIPKAMQPGQIESGMLRSKWNGQYGYIEARIRVPKGRGMWPAFWLNPEDQVWPPEIDILEIVNNGNDTTRNSFHFLHPGEKKPIPTTMNLMGKDGSYRPPFDYADDFHTFAVLWEAGRVRNYVDDKLIADRNFNWTHQGGRDAGNAHVLINLSVGGKWPGPPQRLEDFPARMDVQYIRVWQKR